MTCMSSIHGYHGGITTVDVLLTSSIFDLNVSWTAQSSDPADIYLLKVNDGNNKAMRVIFPPNQTQLCWPFSQ